MLVFAAIFTAIIFAYYRGDRKYSPVSYKSKNVILTKGLGVLIFTGILLVCSLVAGAETFWQGFWLTFGLMVLIGVYDTCFLDWVLFANHTLQMFIREAQ